MVGGDEALLDVIVKAGSESGGAKVSPGETILMAPLAPVALADEAAPAFFGSLISLAAPDSSLESLAPDADESLAEIASLLSF